jgi:hypothetical protein
MSRTLLTLVVPGGLWSVAAWVQVAPRRSGAVPGILCALEHDDDH